MYSVMFSTISDPYIKGLIPTNGGFNRSTSLSLLILTPPCRMWCNIPALLTSFCCKWSVQLSVAAQAGRRTCGPQPCSRGLSLRRSGAPLSTGLVYMTRALQAPHLDLTTINAISTNTVLRHVRPCTQHILQAEVATQREEIILFINFRTKTHSKHSEYI